MTRISSDYMGYGLRFRSAIHLPFTLYLGSCPPTGKPDVIISFGKTPAKLPNPIAKRTRKLASLGRWEADKDFFLMDVPGVARYLVSGGRHVTVEPRSDDNYKIGVFLTGMLTSVLLKQRNITTFHASSIATETGAVLFPGISGSGKSSLVASLINRGYSMLSDDLTGVTLDADGRLTALPAFPCIRLRADMLDILKWPKHEQSREWKEGGKYRLPVESAHRTPIPIHAVYILTNHDQQDIIIKRLSSLDTFRWMDKYLYKKNLMKVYGNQLELFRILETISLTKPTFLVQRPTSRLLIDALTDSIEMDLAGEPLPAGNDAAAGQAASRSVAGG